MIKGVLSEMQELLGCFGTLGSQLGIGVRVLFCGEVININYELFGQWELLVWVFLLVIYIQMR